MKYDLTNIKFILKHLRNPHNNFQSIHIAGTNGKGSTASFIASILMEHGLNVGLFTSPHIIRFNERIRVNGRCVSNIYIKDFLESNEKIIKKIKPSFFEVNTAMAFQYFSRMRVDIAVVECGLGGRLDSTNVIYPELSVIAQIGMDHMQYLGNTLKKIALEKIGIVKPGVDVVVSDNNKSLYNIFNRNIGSGYLKYLDKVCKIKILKSDFKGNRFKLKQVNEKEIFYTTPLPGKFQARNAAAAIMTSSKYLNNIGIKPVKHLIQYGLSNVKENTGLHGRLEVIKHNGTDYILDVSHNIDGLKETLNTLKQYKPNIVIFGIMEEKDVINAVKEVINISDTIIFTKPDYKRAADPGILHEIAEKQKNKSKKIFIANNVSDALKISDIILDNKKRILIMGSFFLVSDAIKALKLQKMFDI